MKDYCSQIFKAVTVPIILYDLPGRTGGNIPADLVVELASEFENVVGIKEASGNLEQMACILRDKPSDFMVFSGDDALAFQAVCMGADGVISVVANLIPKEFHNLMLAASKGDLAKSKEIYFKYLRLIQLCFIESNPIPVKTGLAIMNKLSEEFRSPMSVMVDENRILLVNEITKLKMIYWKAERFWVGKLLEYPEIMTQGETLEELEENMKEAYMLMALDEVPGEHEVKELTLTV